jgi:hypothetical protein
VIQAQCSRYRTTLLVIGFCSVGVHPAAGQRFGRNQVQYRSFGFRVLQTERFDVYFYPEVEDAARDGARMAERWYTRLSQILDHDFTERQPLIPYGSHPAFQPPVPPGRGTRAPRSARAAERDPLACLHPVPGKVEPDPCQTRGVFTSIGAGARLNVLGFLVLEAAHVNPLDRPRGWHWQLSVQPGYRPGATKLHRPVRATLPGRWPAASARSRSYVVPVGCARIPGLPREPAVGGSSGSSG